MQGHLVIADMSGYAGLPTDRELDQANSIVGEQSTAVVTALHAPPTVSGIEVDAVFMCCAPSQPPSAVMKP